MSAAIASQPHPFRELFPVVEEMIYLNHAACSPICRPAVDALTRYLSAQSRRGVEVEVEYFPLIETARERLAALIGAAPEEITWLPNTSTAISTVAHGLAWRDGDNVVTADEQFPANVYPWLGLKQDGVETRLAARRGPGVPLEAIEALIDDRTRLVAVSWVEFNSGYRYDLPALADICHRRGALLLVDAIQGLGGLTLDARAAGVDFLAGAMHKWMLGPQGVGFLYIRGELLDELRPRFANWRSVVDVDNHLSYGQPWVGAARRFEPSTPFMLGLVAADAVLRLIHEAGPAEIERRVLANAQLLADRLREHGHHLVGPADPAPSGVVCFRPRSEDPAALVARLAARDIGIAARGPVVRISPHFYNTYEEIETLFTPELLG